jgi:hypothetical protein
MRLIFAFTLSVAACGPGVHYSLATSSNKTGMAGTIQNQSDTTACSSQFVATGMNIRVDASNRLLSVQLKCTQLKPTGLGTVSSDATTVGLTGGSIAPSDCDPRAIITSVGYGPNVDGIGALCAPLDEWVNPAGTGFEQNAAVVGQTPLTGHLSCGQGYTLTGLTAWWTIFGSPHITAVEGTCTQLLTQ